MYIYGGYIPNKAEYLKDVYSFDFTTLQWVC